MPKVVDHHRRREDLALLTLDVIRAAGIGGATVRQIARRGRLSIGVLTRYFTGKDEMLAFAFRWLAEKTLEELEQLASTHAPGLPRLEAALRLQTASDEPGGIGLWLSLWDRAVRNPKFRNEHRAFYGRWRGFVRTCLRDAAALRQIDPLIGLDEATDLVVAAVDGIWLEGAFEPARFTARRRQLLLRLLVDALTQGNPGRSGSARVRNARRAVS